MLKHITKFLIKCLVVILLLVAALIAYVSTPFGTAQIIHLVQARWLPHLTIRNIQGSLAQQLVLQNIRYADDGNTIDIGYFSFAWSPLQLLRGKLVINSLALKDSRIHTASVKTRQSQPAKTHNSNWQQHYAWLKRLRIHQIKVDNLVIEQPIALTITQLHLDAIDAHNYQLDLQSSLAQAKGNFSWQITPALNWQSSVKVNNVRLQQLFPQIASDFGFNLAVTGEFSSHNQLNWAAKLTQLIGSLRAKSLAGSIDINGSDDKFTINDARLQLANNTFNISGYHQAAWNLQWQAHASIADFMPHMAGSVNATGNITGPDNNVKLNTKLALSNLLYNDIRLQQLKITADGLVFPNPHLTANLNLQRLAIQQRQIPTANAMVTIQQQNNDLATAVDLHIDNNAAQAKLVIFDYLTASPANIAGNIKIAIPRIATIVQIIPQISNIAGSVQGQVNIQGTTKAPQITGNLSLKQGSFDVEKIGLRPRNINLTIDYQAQQPLAVNLRAWLGQGQLTLTGSVNAMASHFPFSAQLRGNNLLVANTKEYKIILAPEINFAYDGSQFTVDGTINLLEGRITPTRFNNVVTLSSDVVMQDQPDDDMQMLDNLNLNLTIAIKQPLYLAYENLTTHLSGELSIKQTPGSLPIASGELTTLNGSYTAYGRVLAITAGRLIYSGNTLMNPGLDIKASKKINTINFASDNSQFITNNNNLPAVYNGNKTVEVGVAVTGTLKQPRANLYSEPAGLAQGDILSYILFGYPQAQITGASSLALLNSLSSSLHFGGDGSNAGVTNQLQKFLGLTDFSIGSTEYFNPDTNEVGNTTSVSIGKKLSKNFSIHYSVGLFYPVSILNLRYRINRLFTLQSETSTIESGADVFYEYEH